MTFYEYNDFLNRLGVPKERRLGMRDTLLSVISHTWVIDIFALDDWLHEKFGDYEDTGLSMESLLNSLGCGMYKDILTNEKYGQKTENVLARLLPHKRNKQEVSQGELF